MASGFGLPFAILDSNGTIVAANQEWLESDRLGVPFGSSFPVGSNYPEGCRDAMLPESAALFDALSDVLAGNHQEMRVAYGQSSDGGPGGSVMRVGRVNPGESPHVLVVHTDAPQPAPSMGVGGAAEDLAHDKIVKAMRALLGRNPTRLAVLVVEDQRADQHLARSILEAMGHSVTVAENGREAAKFFENGAYDLVFMDLDLPVLDGFLATALIRDLEKGTDMRVPIVATAGNGFAPDRARFRRAGMDEVLSKPLDPAAVLELMKDLSPGCAAVSTVTTRSDTPA